MISLNYRDARPIYEQVRDGLRHLVVTGAIAQGERLPSVRALAASLAINPNTIQRAYAALEEEGYLAAEPGKVFTREELMREVWQYDYYGDLRTVDVAMRRFREKLEKNPAEPEYIITRRGAGYYFSD